MKVGLRYAVVLPVVAVALWLGFRDEGLGSVLVSWRVQVARAVLALIHSMGMEAVREGSALYHPAGFAYEISRGCTGFVPAALLATSIAAYPAAARFRVAGLLLGVPLLLALNIARLVHLFYLGAHQPRWFHVAHTVAWEAVIILAVVGLWLAWAAWADRARRSGRGLTRISSLLS